MKLNINLSCIKWILFHNNSCYGFDCKPTMPVDPNDLYPEDYGAVDLTMIVDDIPDEYKLYQYKGGKLIAEPKPVWIPKDGEKVMVRDNAHHPWTRAYSAGSLTKGGELTCYVRDKWLTEDAMICWTFWRKPTEEELR